MGSIDIRTFIQSQRVARLATADGDGRPHVVPVCFVYDGTYFYSAIDQKPKRTGPMGLKRVRNIVANPEVALLLDRYRERWQELAYVMIQGTARILESGLARERAIALLQERYPQYQAMALDSAPVIQITPRRFVPWGAMRMVPEDDEI